MENKCAKLLINIGLIPFRSHLLYRFQVSLPFLQGNVLHFPFAKIKIYIGCNTLIPFKINMELTLSGNNKRMEVKVT